MMPVRTNLRRNSDKETPMIKVENSMEISRPVDEVFAFVSDPGNNAKWQEGLVESRLESAGPVRLGSKITDVRKFLGRQLESRLEVTAFEPGKRFSLKVVSGPLPFQITNNFEPTPAGTRIKYVVEGEPGGLFKLAEGMVKKRLETQLAGDDSRLKKVMEG